MLNCVTQAARTPSRAATANRLRGAASALAFAAALCGVGAAGSAQAQSEPNTNLSPGTLTYLVPGPSEPGSPAFLTEPASVTVTTGENAYVAPAWLFGDPRAPSGSVILGYYGPYDGATLSGDISTANGITTTTATNGGSAAAYQIITQAGSTLTFAGLQTLQAAGVGGGLWVVTYDMVDAAGNVNFEGNGQHFSLDGANTITGNINFEAETIVRFGESYGAAQLTLGPNTTITMGDNSNVYMNLAPTTATNPATTMGGMLTGPSTATLELAGGTLVINGQNTAPSPFLGTLQVDPGATLVIGDAAHASAIFGDPGNTNGSTETLNIGRSGGTPATLEGYGTSMRP